MLVAAVLILYAAGANIWLIAAGVALYGVANGMVTILRGIAVADYISVAGFRRKSGMISAINGFALALAPYLAGLLWTGGGRTEEHTSEIQSLMRNPYAFTSLKKKH